MHGVLHGAELQALQVCGLGDGPPVVGDVPVPVLPVAQVDHPQGGQKGIDLLAQIPVQGPVGRLLGLEEEGKVEDLEALLEARQGGGGGDGHLDGPQLHRLDELPVASELAVGVQLHLDLAAGLGLHVLLEHVPHDDVVRLGLRQDVAHLEGVLRLGGGQAGHGGQPRQGGGQTQSDEHAVLQHPNPSRSSFFRSPWSGTTPEHRRMRTTTRTAGTSPLHDTAIRRGFTSPGDDEPGSPPPLRPPGPNPHPG